MRWPYQVHFLVSGRGSPTLTLLGIRHEDLVGLDPGDRVEAPGGDGLAELGDGPEVAVARALAGDPAGQVLAEDVGGLVHHLARLLGRPQAGREDDDEVLETR